MVTLEEVLDKIADELIYSDYVDSSIVSAQQKTIKNGLISLGRTNSDRLVLYQKDEEANKEDLRGMAGDTSTANHTLLQIIDDFNSQSFTIAQIQVLISPLPPIGRSGDEEIIPNPYQTFIIQLYVDASNQYDITNLLSNDINNPINISQFLNIKQKQTLINQNQANEYLDTNIYELLPDGDTRQDRINTLFAELNILLSGNVPVFDSDGDGVVDRAQGTNDWVGNQDYYLDNSISAAQEFSALATIDEGESFITRLIDNSNELNEDKTIEDIYNTIAPYLTDILEDPPLPQDERPEYETQSSGYLKFRNPNQGIIIRNTTQDYVEGLNPITQDYLETGFTITMWVRFLDKTSSGTLFNFGNPTRGAAKNEFGFRLETYVLGRDEQTDIGYDGDGTPGPDFPTWGDYASGIAQERTYYEKTDTERFVRLIVMDKNDKLRDSHIGVPGRQKTTDVPGFTPNPYYDLGLMSATHIPEDFTEWYFIVATFNKDVVEDDYIVSGTTPTGTDQTHDKCLDLTGTPECGRTPYFWRNNINASGYTPQSLEGNKCKVEIISKTDLLRARGYKV